jgi:hypothetical protein
MGPVGDPVADAQRRSWWQRRRLAYNAGLVVAGIAAFGCYATVFSLIPEGTVTSTGEPPEMTAFTVAFQAALYVATMLIANVCYGLGPLVERVIRPREATSFRRRTFTLGLAFSMALPFTVPLLLYFGCVRGPC